MCVSKRWIVNRYTGQELLVNCGRCPACLQEKANRRASKIKNFAPDGYTCYFVTLTYRDQYIPYLLKSEIVQCNNHLSHNYPVHRDRQARYTYDRHSQQLRFKYVVPKNSKFTDISFEFLHFKVDSFPTLAKYPDRVAIAYYKDFQDFVKRLRYYLVQSQPALSKIYYYGASEYGPATSRPHFHALLYVPTSASYDTVKKCVRQAWPFCASHRWTKGFQVARDASKYLASYVNSFTDLADILRDKSVCPKCSHSANFFNLDNEFSLSEIVRRFQNEGTTRYIKNVFRDGVQVPESFPLPQFVKYRYFPLFKGYFQFTDDEIYDALRAPAKFFNSKYLSTHGIKDENGETIYPFRRSRITAETICYSYAQLRSTRRYISRCYHRAKSIGFSPHDFARLCIDFRRKEFSENLQVYHNRLSLKDYYYAYDNVIDFFTNVVDNEQLHFVLAHASPTHGYLDDPNHFPQNLRQHSQLLADFSKYNKARKLNNHE